MFTGRNLNNTKLVSLLPYFIESHGKVHIFTVYITHFAE
jgi:hypothetical protein